MLRPLLLMSFVVYKALCHWTKNIWCPLEVNDQKVNFIILNILKGPTTLFHVTLE